jgi:hypothetical protein
MAQNFGNEVIFIPYFEEYDLVSAMEVVMSSNHLYEQQKCWLSVSWTLSLHARITLPNRPQSTDSNAEYCRSHSILCSAASLACIAALLLDSYGKQDSIERLQTSDHHGGEQVVPDFVLGVILTAVNAVLGDPSNQCYSQSQMSQKVVLAVDSIRAEAL